MNTTPTILTLPIISSQYNRPCKESVKITLALHEKQLELHKTAHSIGKNTIHKGLSSWKDLDIIEELIREKEEDIKHIEFVLSSYSLEDFIKYNYPIATEALFQLFTDNCWFDTTEENLYYPTDCYTFMHYTGKSELLEYLENYNMLRGISGTDKKLDLRSSLQEIEYSLIDCLTANCDYTFSTLRNKKNLTLVIAVG